MLQLCNIATDLFTVKENRVYPSTSSMHSPATKAIPTAADLGDKVANHHYVIVLKNLASEVSEDDLLILFSGCGRVLSTKINTDENSGEVTMDNLSNAQEAIDAFNGAPLDGQTIQCILRPSPIRGKPIPNGLEMSSVANDTKVTSSNAAAEKTNEDPIVIVDQKLPPDLKKEDFLEVYVTEVFTPGNFYVQLRKHQLVIDQMMEDLE